MEGGEGRVSFWVEGFNSSTGGVARFIDVDNEHCRALRVRHDCVLAPGERWTADGVEAWGAFSGGGVFAPGFGKVPVNAGVDRKSTRLNSSHVSSSYAVFCSKNKRSI